MSVSLSKTIQSTVLSLLNFLKQGQLIFKWRIANRDVYQQRFLHDTFPVGKGIETVFAMVASHSTISNAAKRHIGGCKVHYRIIDAASSVGNMS